MPSAENHRQHERYPVHLEASGRIGDNAFAGHVTDISMGGAAISTPDVGYQNDQFVRLHMVGMGETQGQVRRQILGGFAVQFLDDGMSEEELRRRDEAIAEFRKLSERARRG